MASSSVHPKLLLEFYKDQKVPKLVKKSQEVKNNKLGLNDKSFRSQTNNQNVSGTPNKLFQSHVNSQPYTYSNPHHYLYGHSTNKSASTNEVLQKHYKRQKQESEKRMKSRQKLQNMQRQKKQSLHSINSRQTVHNNGQSSISDQKQTINALMNENMQLREIIFELTNKSDKLKEVNQQLLQRVNQLQNKLNIVAEQADRQKNYGEKRVTALIYKEIQQFMKVSIQSFTASLAHQKMSPIVENKIEGFLEQLLNINQVSVKNVRNMPRIQRNNRLHNISQQQVNKTINEIIQRERGQSKQRSNSKKSFSNRKRSPNRYQYHTVFEHFAVNNTKSQVVQPYSKIRNTYNHNTGTPSRIFDRLREKQISESPKNRSRSQRRIKIFNKSNASNSYEKMRRYNDNNGQEVRLNVRRNLGFQ